MSKAVKLADIAQIVGVSTVTVSKALADKKGVSESLRAKIKQVAEERDISHLLQKRKCYNQRTTTQVY